MTKIVIRMKNIIQRYRREKLVGLMNEVFPIVEFISLDNIEPFLF